jgi:hypothetical protein
MKPNKTLILNCVTFPILLVLVENVRMEDQVEIAMEEVDSEAIKEDMVVEAIAPMGDTDQSRIY